MWQGGGDLTSLARDTFSLRCQTVYGECMGKLSDGGSLSRRRQRIRPEHRVEREHRYTFKQWIELKSFLEHAYYGVSAAKASKPHGRASTSLA